MSGLLKNMFGGESGAVKPDDEFADFVEAPQPSPASVFSSSPTLAASPSNGATVPYTAWYRVWERTSPKDFMQEAMVLPFVILIIVFHLWGTRKNRRKAKEWAKAHATALQNEFAVVGFGDLQGTATPDSLIKENSPQEFVSYATGRQNVAFVDISVKLPKRYNPVTYWMDYALSFLWESWAAPIERIEATSYAFDGKEKDLVPVPAKDSSALKVNNSAYDGFIWAIVHKSCMRKVRQDRYDASITFTKDHAKLPPWVTVMTESAEITDALLTPELIKAIEQAGHEFEYLIVTDQPTDKPLKIEETTPRKRISLSMHIPSASDAYASTMPLFQQFLGFADKLVASAHFRAEVMRKVRNVREAEIKKLRRADEEEKAEERKLAAERLKKEERERILRSMTADEQRKYLDREKEKETRRSTKKATRRA
ncbi:unnamed protein product [Penicillium nalgiovense]|uniref:DUF1682 domain protein n=1 Tax=Penicillium nalgiovense TaxID=60175 RepID=A0A1V6YWM3_PENNA|nr:hypothetical protein PENNAL_c0008G05713 [Penicillium nalgiovense]CAG7936370.1 unnamed protein product [Penicillium nalgiovense]CAG7937842.1 unnamed protein product [Penicillium nalgiovense]CAG7939686.1 unnamed protein product [Penicillium nalgiovense]CAG7940262.1 unnamed protein product [Penicillium nalgiovense]